MHPGTRDRLLFKWTVAYKGEMFEGLWPFWQRWDVLRKPLHLHQQQPSWDLIRACQFLNPRPKSLRGDEMIHLGRANCDKDLLEIGSNQRILSFEYKEGPWSEKMKGQTRGTLMVPPHLAKISGLDMWEFLAKEGMISHSSYREFKSRL